MKKILLLIFALISINAFSQLQVKEGSFRYVPGGVIDNKVEYTDGNDLPMALIKISTENINEQERLRLVFTGNRATQIIKKPKTGEMWIYISADAATFINIKHPDYGTCKYYLPEELCDYCVYEMVLQYIPYIPETDNRPKNNAVTISADIDDALIYVDEQFVGEKEVSMFLPIGSTHTWKIECELYHVETGNFTVSSEEAVAIEKKMRPAYGFLNVTSKPESGAMVFVNNKKVGQTPYKSDKLASGKYLVKVVKEMYSTMEVEYTVADGQTTEAVMDMNAKFVDAKITTDDMSDIYIDEKKIGKGSWNGRLTEGQHYVEARKDKHKSTYKTINVELGKDITITLDAPKPICGFLEISSSPLKADIYIDSKHYGQTPKVIDDLLIGEHKLRLSKQGCADLNKTINIKEGETLSINEKLQTGKDISISTGKSGDKVYVDGEYVGVSPITTNLSYGTHELKATRDSQTASKTIEVKVNGGESNHVLAFGKLVKITSSKLGDDIYVNGKKVGQTSMDIDLPLGKYEIEVRRGKLVDTKSIDITKNGTSLYNFYPRKEALGEYLKRGVNFVTLNAAYSVAPQMSFGITYGQVKKFGWFVSAMSNLGFRFSGNDWNDMYHTDGIVDFSGKSSKARFSVTGGFVARLFGPIYAKIGAGYGARVKYWEVAGKWYEYTLDTYKGFDLTAGIMVNTRKCAISADVVTTSFKTMEIKLGVGLNWNK